MSQERYELQLTQSEINLITILVQNSIEGIRSNKTTSDRTVKIRVDGLRELINRLHYAMRIPDESDGGQG